MLMFFKIFYRKVYCSQKNKEGFGLVRVWFRSFSQVSFVVMKEVCYGIGSRGRISYGMKDVILEIVQSFGFDEGGIGLF